MIDALTVAEALGDGTALIGADGVIRWSSARLGELAGLPVASAWPELELREGEQRVLVRGETPAAVRISPTSDGWALVARELAPWVGEAAPRRRAHQPDVDRVLGRVFRNAMRASGDELETEDRLEEVARVLAAEGGRLVPDVDVMLALIEPGRPGVIRVAGAAGPWASKMLGRHLPFAGSFVQRSVAAQRPVETTDAQSHTVNSELLVGGDIRSMRLVPVIASEPLPDGRTALGTIGFYSRSPRAFTPRQRTLIDAFAGLVGLSLQRAALLRAVRQTARRLEMAILLAADISATLDEREVVRRMLDRLLETVAAERAALLRIDGEETVVVDSRDVLNLPDVLGFRQPSALQPLMQEALATKRPVVGGAYDRRILPPQLQRALSGVRHTLTVPLVLGGGVIAAVVLSRRRDRVFGEDEVATVQLVGNLAALALRNAWLFAEAQAASRTKSDFLNMAAHELRTPLTVVAGYMSLLRDGSFGPAPADWQHPVETLAAKTVELGRLVEDLLLASRLDSGGLPVNRDRLDLSAAARAAVGRAQARAALLGADLELEGASGVEVAADPDHLGRILDNLINNALTYSRATPWVRVRVVRRPEGPAVEVEDRGRGIPAAQAERIFERFYRLEQPGGSQQPGTGLGLYISRELALRQHARLWLDWSEPGEGTRFVLGFPRDRT
ncbi:MAG TPA: ATP-binding protein [Candidatus Dormibacteraeota bacterium]